MKILGIGMIGLSAVFFWAAGHALGMYSADGDPRWLLTVIFGPMFGLMTIYLGRTISGN